MGSQVLLWPRTLQLVWLALSNMVENRHAGLIRKLLCSGKKCRHQRHENENIQAVVKWNVPIFVVYVPKDLVSNL